MGALLIFTFSGCIKIKDELTIAADGSGQVRLETQLAQAGLQSLSQGLGMGMMGNSDNALYPPVDESEIQKFFPAKDFTVTVKPEKDAHGVVTLVTVAAFKDINALLASPYGRAHQLSMNITNGSLVVRGITGLEATARFADAKDSEQMRMVPGLADLRKQTNSMRDEFRITLPNAVSAANGTPAGNSAAWITDQSGYTNNLDFARQLSVVAEIKCPATGLKFTPVTPVRLGLQPFAELVAGVVDTGTPVDTNKIVAAVQFVPCSLSVTRSLDLSGEGGSQPSSAQFSGAVLLPQELQPQKWGDPKLDEVTDAKGNDLKPADNDENRFSSRSFSSRFEGDDEDDTNQPSHLVTMEFRAPDWKIKEIARIKGSIDLQYFGGSQVVKLTNAVPAAWIVDASKGAGSMMGMDRSEKNLQSETLAALGLDLSVQMGMTQPGVTMLMLVVKGKDASLLDAQVFDANGQPWPTQLQAQNFGGESGMCQVIVAGKPQPPLSLGLQVSGHATTVTVPILVEHVSLSH